MATATPAARKALERQRKSAQGLTQVTHWIPDTQKARDAMKKLAERLRGEKA